jgi:hypothetical protein
MAKQELSQAQVIQAVYAYAAHLIKVGHSRMQVEDRLVERGLDREAASTVVDKLLAMRAEAQEEAARKDMLYGALWCLGGVLVTALTYIAAEGGGVYIVWWGAIVYGAIRLFRGLSQSSE